MIRSAHITAWRSHAPWSTNAQIEQDLVLSRAIVELFSDAFVKEHLAFRGGTALRKLILRPPARYSEDIDLVQVRSEAIGPTMAALRSRLDSWLGEPSWKQSAGRVTMIYRFKSELPPITPLRVKVELNTREHLSILGFRRHPFHIESRWFSGSAEIRTYEPEELMGTKLRALYQRRKGRDLFDLDLALQRIPGLNLEKTVTCFLRYMEHDGTRVSRAEFESNMAAKMRDRIFHADLGPLLAVEAPESHKPYEAHQAYARVHEAFISRLPGEPWKGQKKGEGESGS